MLFAVEVVCPANYTRNPFANTCIRLVKTAKSWADARDHCELSGELFATFATWESAQWFVHLRKTTLRKGLYAYIYVANYFFFFSIRL